MHNERNKCPLLSLRENYSLPVIINADNVAIFFSTVHPICELSILESESGSSRSIYGEPAAANGLIYLTNSEPGIYLGD